MYATGTLVAVDMLLPFVLWSYLSLVEGPCTSHPTADHRSYLCSDGLNVGSVCTFQCDRGYELHGGVYLTCEDRGGGSSEWDEVWPLCTDPSGTCTSLLVPSNGEMSCNNEFIMGVICSFSCSPGYVLDGTSPLICDHLREWNSQPPLCIRDAPTCDTLPVLDHGSIACTDGNQVGSICSFSCEESFTLSDDSNATCVESTPETAAWSAALPTCYHTCQPMMASPNNGSVTCSASNTESSVCSFACDEGYLVSEVNVVVSCVNTVGAWNWDRPPPTCDEIPVKCPDIHPSQFTQNTLYRCTNENNRGSVCSFSCDNGAELNTNASDSTCLDPRKKGFGEWTPELPNCFFSACEKPPIVNGEPTCPELVPGSVCGVECFSGFLPSSPTTFTCTKLGTWDGIIPQCKSAPCLPPLHKISQQTSCSKGNAPGSICELACTSHLKSKNPARYTCGDSAIRNGAGFWKENIQECLGCGHGLLDIFILIDASANLKPIDFAKLMEFLAHVVKALGKLIDVGSSWIGIAVAGSKEPVCDPRRSISDFRSEIPLRNLMVPLLLQKLKSIRPIGGCFHLGSSLAKAVTSIVRRRRPNIMPIIVTIISGPSFDDFSGSVTMANEAGVKFIVVGFGAAKGFRFIDITTEKEAIIYIPAADLFPSASPHVINLVAKADCPGLSRCAGPILDGEVVCVQSPGKKTPFNEICSANCNKGFALVGNSTALCGDANGDGNVEWISPLGFCKEIRCLERGPPEDGFMSCDNDNIFPSLCKYFCIPNYFMIGLSESFCGDPDKDGEGEWSSEVPLCVADLLCTPALSAPHHGIMKCSKNNSFGSQCEFSCEDGYEIRGNGIVNCGTALADGSVEWTDPPPTCAKCKTETCKLDLIVVMDGSGSIRSREFAQMKEWVIEVLGAYKGEIDSGGTRVGLIQFSGEATFMCDSGEILPKYAVELELARYSFYEVRKKIRDIGHLKGCTATGDAISRAVKHFDALGRLKVDRVMIVVTDGKSNDDVVKPAEEARRRNIKIIAIGIGKFEQKELQEIAGSKNVIDISSFDELDSSVSTVQEEIQSQIEEDVAFLVSSGTPAFSSDLVVMITFSTINCWCGPFTSFHLPNSFAVERF